MHPILRLPRKEVASITRDDAAPIYLVSYPIRYLFGEVNECLDLTEDSNKCRVAISRGGHEV